MMLVRVMLPRLCAGVVVEQGSVIDAAPILQWAVGRSLEYLVEWVLKRRGAIEVVSRF